LSYKNIAVIGAGGFIGKHLINYLSKNSNGIIKGFGRNCSVKDEHILTPIELNNKDEIKSLLQGIELVYYLASGSIPASSWNNPSYDIKNNLLPFINFLDAAVEIGVKKVVFVSSAGTVYGTSELPLDENSNKLPFSPYGINKLTMEYYLQYFNMRYQLLFDIYRVSNVYGVGQNTKKGLGIINTFLEKIIRNERIEIFGNGENIRNYVYVNDVAEILSFSASKNITQSQILNLASDDTLSINQLLKQIKDTVNTDFKVKYSPARQSDNPAILISNKKLKATYPEFNFTTLSNGIAETHAYLKEKSVVNKP